MLSKKIGNSITQRKNEQFMLHVHWTASFVFQKSPQTTFCRKYMWSAAVINFRDICWTKKNNFIQRSDSPQAASHAVTLICVLRGHEQYLTCAGSLPMRYRVCQPIMASCFFTFAGFTGWILRLNRWWSTMKQPWEKKATWNFLMLRCVHNKELNGFTTMQ